MITRGLNNLRVFFKKTLSPRLYLDNSLVWDGVSFPFHEAYDIICHDQNPRWALWLRYALYNSSSNKKNNTALLLAVFLDQENKKYYLAKKPFELNSHDILHSDRFVSLGDSYISLAESSGFLHGEGLDIKWDISFEDPKTSLRIYPNHLFYIFKYPGIKFVQPRLKSLASGQIFVNHIKKEVRQMPVYQEHFYGTSQPVEWSRAGCVNFKEDSTAGLEILSFRPVIKNRILRPLIFCCLQMDGKKYSANSMIKMLTNKSDLSNNCWVCEFKAQGRRFVLSITRDPGMVIGLASPGIKNKVHYTDMSLDAKIKITAFKKHRGKWIFNKTLSSDFGCFFETTSLSKPANRPLAL
ncbi:MAG: hypothetical protein HQM16_05945 [Deltaproteobacteria bacterium]|nr:hypothetical protein [Deltaproteobacteria bacterium]